MKGVFLIARRDFLAYFNTIWGYLILATVLLIDGLLFNVLAMGSTARYSAEVLDQFFWGCSGTTMIAAIILTMRLFAEERSQGTMVLLDTAPVSDLTIVLGKFLAAFAMIALVTVLTLYMPAQIFVNGKVSPSQIFAGYLGLLCIGASTVAIGTWGSSISRSQLVAAVVSALTVTLLLLSWMAAKTASPPFKDILSYVALYDHHFQPFQKGRINTESLVYHASVTFGFLMLTVRGLQGRRWR